MSEGSYPIEGNSLGELTIEELSRINYFYINSLDDLPENLLSRCDAGDDCENSIIIIGIYNANQINYVFTFCDHHYNEHSRCLALLGIPAPLH